MLPIVNLKVRSLDVDSKEVTWQVSGNSDEDALDYRLSVLRSESPQGPYEEVSPAFEDRYIFVDRRIPSNDKFRKLWYKLRSERKSNGKITEYGPAAHEPEADLVAQAIRLHQQTMFVTAIGRKVWLFKRRTFGQSCTTCYDPVLAQRVAERCLDCYGTGYTRGYHNPIEVWMQIDPPAKSQQNNGPGIVQIVITAARMSFYPNVDPGDLIVEAENKRWEVDTVQTSERLRATVKQEITKMHQLDETSIKFRVPINLDRALRDIQPNPPMMMDNPQDLNAAIEARTPDVFAAYKQYPKTPEE
jgi:hypothetical protein